MFYARLLVYLLSTYSAAAITGSLDDQPYDAILFRTHLLDRMTLQKLFELKQECNVLNAKVLTTATHYSSTVSNNMKNVVLPAVQYELNILYDHDTIPEFETILASHGFQFNEFSSVSSSSSSESSHQDIRRDRSNHPMVRVTPISLDTFTQYPNVKPLDISKSHYQHLVWTTWWRLNRDRKNWRFVWCMEHDVGVSGGYWRHVLDYHLSLPYATRDLISWRIGWTPRPDPIHTKSEKQWNIRMRYGPLLNYKQIQDSDVSLHFGPLLRFSTKYLSYLEKQSMKGNTGHSEIVLTTLCNITDWCSMGNLSVDVMGGRDGGLFDYKLSKEINSFLLESLSKIRPGYLFHPVRDVSTMSDSQHLQIMKKNHDETTHGNLPSSITTSITTSMTTQGFVTSSLNTSEYGLQSLSKAEQLIHMYMAKCLLRNTRPPYPSYNCPIGCPWHHQVTCSTINCMARQNGTYLHMGAIDCLSLCRTTMKCPWTTNTQELKEIAKGQKNFVGDMLEDLFLPSVAGPA